MEPPPYPLPPGYNPTPPAPPPWWKRLFGPLATVLLVGGKFFAKLKFLILPVMKFLPVILKTGGSMILSIGMYSMIYGWRFAVGFVLLILVHEGGHLIAARWCGLPVGAPVFIPFMGAFIALKEAPKNAWIEAIVSIGGPVAGCVGALVCHVIYLSTQEPIWLALAYTGYFLNLFNLMPVGMLDGGRIVNAVSPWLLLPGLGMLVWFMFEYGPNFILILILIFALPKVLKLFWSRTEEEERYYEATPGERVFMGLCYFGLAGFLFYQMSGVMETLQGMGHWKD